MYAQMLQTSKETFPLVEKDIPTDIVYYGNSFLLRRVVEILSSQYGKIASIRLIENPEQLRDSKLLHDGTASEDICSAFSMDFNISDYGKRPDKIATNLINRLFCGLV